MIGEALSIQGLKKTYPDAEHPVFDGFSLDVEAGCLCALVGVSGVGKTTLLNCVAGLDRWEGGSIRIGEMAVPESVEDRSLYRREHIGLAFQQPHLLPEFTVRENLEMPFRIEAALTAGREEWIQKLLELVGLSHLSERLPNQLSSGQAARVGLARALVRKPALWLLDEPTGNLDPETADEAFALLLKLHQELRPTTLLVTHNPDLAGRCERTVRLGTH